MRTHVLAMACVAFYMCGAANSRVQADVLHFYYQEEPRLNFTYNAQTRTILEEVQRFHPELYGTPKPTTYSARISGQYIIWESAPTDGRPGPSERININTGELDMKMGSYWNTLRHCNRR